MRPTFSGVIMIGLLPLLSGCGPSERELREKTLSTLNSVADTWEGGAEFKTDAADAYGNRVVAKVSKGVLNYDLELRSHGLDGLPKNSDDIVVHRSKRHGESSVNREIEAGAESVGRGGVRGIIEGAKEAFTGKNKEPKK